jgi:hypothetical protein
VPAIRVVLPRAIQRAIAIFDQSRKCISGIATCEVVRILAMPGSARSLVPFITSHTARETGSWEGGGGGGEWGGGGVGGTRSPLTQATGTHHAGLEKNTTARVGITQIRYGGGASRAYTTIRPDSESLATSADRVELTE